MNVDVSRHRQSYANLGYTVLREFVPNATAWYERVLASGKAWDVYTAQERREVRAGDGFLKYRAMDRFLADHVLPELGGLYFDTLSTIRELAHPEASTSPYERTAYYVKIYDPPDGQQGWHYDTNAITAILYLSSHPQTGYTAITSLDGTGVHVVKPEAGSLLLMQGRECWHRAEPTTSGTKVICPLNYYIGPAEPRDPRLDSIIFGPGEHPL